MGEMFSHHSSFLGLLLLLTVGTTAHTAVLVGTVSLTDVNKFPCEGCLIYLW